MSQKNSSKEQAKEFGARCSAERALQVLAGRWKLLLLRELFQGTRRFSELQRAMQNISPKVLSEQLRELEADDIIVRHVLPETPPRVEYSLSAHGRSLQTVLGAMHQWEKQESSGEAHPKQNKGTESSTESTQ